MPSAGERYRGKGYTANLPILIVPGLCSSILKVEDSPHEPWINKRIWLNLSAIGMGKVWDFNNTLWGDSKKKKQQRNAGPARTRAVTLSSSTASDSTSSVDSSKDDDDDDEQMAEIDTGLKRRWIQHMILQEDGVSDPPGIKLRVEKGLKGCAYLEPSNKALRMLSYVFGPFLEDLAALGYSDDNLKAAPYDWRVPPAILQSRDGYFDEVKGMIEEMVRVNGKKVVVLGHSLGTRCVQYFLNWAEKHHGRQWISQNVHTFIAVGPLFLGSPKAVRAMITGERMGMEAFLYPHEGLWLNRRIGSLPWMFPVRAKGNDMLPPSKVRKGKSRYKDIDDMEVLNQIYPPMCNIYKTRYVGDPLHGNSETMIKAPPVEKLFAIYGVNLDTEAFVCVKQTDTKDGKTLSLDRSGRFPHYKMKGGIGYETKSTPQKCLDGLHRSGDGTVPYASLSYCKQWSESGMQVRIEELDLCDHRDILVDKRFKRLVIEYVCSCAPSELPESFPELKYEVVVIFGGRRHKCYMLITRRGIEVTSRGIGPVKVKCRYEAVENVSVNDNKADSFSIEAVGAGRLKRLRSAKRREIVEEIASRCRYADRMMSDEDEEEEERDEFGQTPLHQCASENKVADVARLVGEGADVNVMDKNGWTPLHCAVRRGHLDVVLCLLQNRDCNVNLVDRDQFTALQYLIQLKFDDSVDGMKKLYLAQQIMDMLMTRGANLDICGKGGISPLHNAVLRGNEDAARFLLEHGHKINVQDNAGDTALHVAIKADQKRCYNLLIERHADIHIPNKAGVTPISLAKNSYPSYYKLLCGATSEAFPQVDSATAIHMAVQKPRMDWLFAAAEKGRGEAINSRDRQGLTPLLYAASGGDLNSLAVLLQFPELDACAASDNDTTALHYLARYTPKSHEKALYARIGHGLIERGLTISCKNKTGETPLHYAVLANNKFGLAWLSDNGADTNALNSKNESPLHYAVHARMMDMLKLLVNKGADITLKPPGPNSVSPLELAEKVDDSFAKELKPSKAPVPAISVENVDTADASPTKKLKNRQSVFVTLSQAQQRRSKLLEATGNMTTPSIIIDDVDEEDDDDKDEESDDDEETENELSAPTLQISRQTNNRRTVVFSRRSPLSLSSSQDGNRLKQDRQVQFGAKEHPKPRAAPSTLRPGRADRAATPPSSTSTVAAPSGRDRQWKNVMYALKRTLDDGIDVEGHSTGSRVRVTINSKGDVTNVVAEKSAGQEDYVVAMNDALLKQRNALKRRQQRALSSLADPDIVKSVTEALGLEQ